MTSMTTTEALVLHAAHDLRLERRVLEALAENEVQVAVKKTGLCGSDLHYFHHFRNGDIIVREPLCLGHESAGIVTAIGSNVTNLVVGDAVALEVGVACSTPACEYCSPGNPVKTNGTHLTNGHSNGHTIGLTNGATYGLKHGLTNGISKHNLKPKTEVEPKTRYNLCPSMRFRSSAKSNPHYQGTLQSTINHPATWCHKLPAGISLELGALLEPLSVAIHATRRSQITSTPGANVLVFGAGAVGLLCAYMARRSGAKKVVIADIDSGRVSFATRTGFAHAGFVVPRSAKNPAQMSTEEKLASSQANAQAIIQTTTSITNGTTHEEPLGQPEIIFECTGSELCVQTSIYAAKAGGKVMLVGMGTPVQTLPLSAAALREVDLLGVFRYADTYAEGIRIVSEETGGTGVPGLPDLRSLITHRYQGLDGAQDAFEMAGRTVDGEGGLVLKVMVET